MVTEHRDAATGSPKTAGSLAEDALEVLRDIDEWQLPEERWADIGELVESLTEALAAGDHDGVRKATAALEVAAPVRTTRIGAKPRVPSPEPIRERVNRLVHALEPPRTTVQDNSSPERNDDRRQSQ
jgi:hypothetical protein